MKHTITMSKTNEILRYFNFNREQISYQFTKVSQALVVNVHVGKSGLPCGSFAVGIINDTTIVSKRKSMKPYS